MVVLLVKGYSQKIHEGNNSDLGRHSLLFALPNLCTVISPGVKQSMSLSRFGSAITRYVCDRWTQWSFANSIFYASANKLVD